MKVIEGLDKLPAPVAESVLTIGNFDGVHRGHQQLLAQAGLRAANTGGPVIVLTFEPHPASVITPDHAPSRLMTGVEKRRALAEAGADLIVIAKSEPALLGLEPEQFVDDILWKRFHPTHIVEGPNFGFGRKRRGTPEMLRELAGRHGCEVHILKPVTLEIDERETLLVSSTVIRDLIRQGKVRRASLCLGRPYALLGRVVRGAQRGRRIGVPTANLEPEDQLVPGESVYSGVARIGNLQWPCAISIGRTPTFSDGALQIEAHLLDFDGDLYDKPMRLEFHHRLRHQQKFNSTEALAEQLQKDIATVRQEAGSLGGSEERTS